MFIPTTKNELKKLGWNQLDVILITGDTYIDSPYIGISIIGKILIENGYKVGIIAQPGCESNKDISRLGEPKLFWGITAGSVDSMVANYTALKKKRQNDDFTPGGTNDKRPDRASMFYTNLIRRYFKNTAPVVLGGIEASLRRITHYDFWSNKVRKPILFDAKADYLIYGMGERSVLQLAENLKNGESAANVNGLCYISREKNPEYLTLPSFDQAVADKKSFIKMFDTFHQNNDPLNAKGLQQKIDDRYLIQNPPAQYLSQPELDEVHDLDFERDVHPFYGKNGKVKALDTIRFSIPSHRGCYGDCNFCAITVHQGRTVRWRSEKSIVNEAKIMARQKDFKGSISDVGGPTANMYGFECLKKLKSGACKDKRCLFPEPCKALKPDYSKQISLLQKLKNIEKIKKVFVASGLRYDMVLNDKKFGNKYFEILIKDHVSGQLKIAPEHTSSKILQFMGKPDTENLIKFKNKFYEFSKKTGKKQFLTYYFIAAHPGCSDNEMKDLKKYVSESLKLNPEQVQVFTPTPSTYSTLMYYTETDYKTGKSIFVEKDKIKKQKQKDLLTSKSRFSKKRKFDKKNK